MTNNIQKIGVFLGRFQPFHRGHYRIVQEALDKVDELIVVLGSDEKAVNTRDPLTTQERIRIIKASLTPKERERVTFAAVPDYVYNNDKWIAATMAAVRSARLGDGKWVEHRNFFLCGMHKDETSFYLNLFPNWGSYAMAPVDNPNNVVSATDVRQKYWTFPEVLFKRNATEFVTDEARDLFFEIMESKPALKVEEMYERNYPGLWGPGPHLTVDSVITQAGHVLLIQRGKEYGHGKWAAPGGFINLNERTEDAMLRELEEETKIKVPKKVLKGCIKGSKLYDAPHRSNRARVITHAYHIQLDNVGKLPKVVGSDDAMDAKWVPISKFLTMRSEMFEDHFDLISDILGL